MTSGYQLMLVVRTYRSPYKVNNSKYSWTSGRQIQYKSYQRHCKLHFMEDCTRYNSSAIAHSFFMRQQMNGFPSIEDLGVDFTADIYRSWSNGCRNQPQQHSHHWWPPTPGAHRGGLLLCLQRTGRSHCCQTPVNTQRHWGNLETSQTHHNIC